VEGVLFAGVQASGKRTFCKERFFDTHVRISLDTLKTPHRERLLVEACPAAQQPFVIDNTNTRTVERAVHIATAKSAGFRVAGYDFSRNSGRPSRAQEPSVQASRRCPFRASSAPGTVEPPLLAWDLDELHRRVAA
jgi:hypothetical protein